MLKSTRKIEIKKSGKNKLPRLGNKCLCIPVTFMPAEKVFFRLWAWLNRLCTRLLPSHALSLPTPLCLWHAVLSLHSASLFTVWACTLLRWLQKVFFTSMSVFICIHLQPTLPQHEHWGEGSSRLDNWFSLLDQDIQHKINFTDVQHYTAKLN